MRDSQEGQEGVPSSTQECWSERKVCVWNVQCECIEEKREHTRLMCTAQEHNHDSQYTSYRLLIIIILTISTPQRRIEDTPARQGDCQRVDGQ